MSGHARTTQLAIKLHCVGVLEMLPALPGKLNCVGVPAGLPKVSCPSQYPCRPGLRPGTAARRHFGYALQGSGVTPANIGQATLQQCRFVVKQQQPACGQGKVPCAPDVHARRQTVT